MQNKQRGAIMIEAAYVLPFMLLVVLLQIEAVNYASDRLYANNIMTDMNQLVMSHANQTSTSGQDVGFTICNADGRVEVLDTQAEAALRSNFEAAIGVNPDAMEILYKPTVTNGVTSFVVEVSVPSSTVVLPEAFATSFPLTTNMILSIDLSC